MRERRAFRRAQHGGDVALAPSTGGEVPQGTQIGGSNPAEPGVAQASAGDPVNPENGDFSQSATDLSIPGFGPELTFSRTYDALLAQQQTVAGTPGPLGYGWTDNWATSLTLNRPAPGDIYTLAGLATDTMDSGTTTSYSYSADGERLSAVQGGSTIASGTWNGAAQLTSYSNASADMSAASYDGLGLRATATTGSASQSFVWNDVSEVPQIIMDSGSAYIYTIGAAPAEQVDLSTGAVTYLMTDSLGSVRGVVSGSGALAASTSYDAWGSPETAGGLSANTPFGYAGGYTDPTGLVYLINRYYDPATGQFMSVDPALAQTTQPYTYASANPVSMTDPNGMCSWWSSRCWEYYFLLGIAEAAAMALAGFISWFCDSITWGFCAVMNWAWVRILASAAYGLLQTWWFHWCSSGWCYLWTFLALIVSGGLWYAPGRLLSRFPYMLDRIRIAVYFRAWSWIGRWF